MSDLERDPVELRRAVDETAQLARVLTFTFLSVWLYLIVTAAATTHRDLLIGRDVTLPILGVGVPLHMFYALAPLLFLVLHGNLLLHLQVLARRLDRFDTALARLAPAEQAHQRSLLAPFPFVEWLSRRGAAGAMAGAYGVVNIALYVILPLAGLVLLQLRFAAYQSDLITGWHTVCVAADLALIAIIWPTVLRPERSPLAAALAVGRDGVHRRGLIAVALAGIVSLAASVWVWSDMHGGYVVSRLDLRDQMLVVAEPGRESVVTYQQRLQDAGLGEARAHLELGRPIDLTGRNLRHADLRNARLFGARLGGADLRGARLGRARLDGARLGAAKLDGAVLVYADLTGADLTDASLRGADLAFARLRGTDLTGAIFDGADLWGTELAFAYVCAPQDLDLRRRDEEGPCPSPRFIASKLNGAVLVGATLPGVDLTAADLRFAQLQGAKLDDAKVRAAVLQGTNVWRSRLNAIAELPPTTRRQLESRAMTVQEAQRRLAEACRVARPERFGMIRDNLARLARDMLDDLPEACGDRIARAEPDERTPPLDLLAPDDGRVLPDGDPYGGVPAALAEVGCTDPWRLAGVVRRLRDDWPGGRTATQLAAPTAQLGERCEQAEICAYVPETARRILESCPTALGALEPLDAELVRAVAKR